MQVSYPAHKKWLKAMQQGQKKYQQRRLIESLQAYQKAIKAAPDRAESWCNLGGVQLAAKHPQDALRSLNKAIELNPNIMQTYLNMGDVFRHLNQVDNAIRAYSIALELKRSPLSLNKLACALRQVNKCNQAEQLYREAIGMQADFTIARINLATVLVELKQFPRAYAQLKELSQLKLTPEEREEVETVQKALAEYQRINPAIQQLREGNLHKLNAVLAATPREHLEPDSGIVAALSRYAASADQPDLQLQKTALPKPRKDWAQIEALFMIPLVENASAFRLEMANLEITAELTMEQRESLNMIDVIQATDKARSDMSQPILAEAHLRYWHALALNGLTNYMHLPGHFKLTANLTLQDLMVHRAAPHLVAGSFRYYIEDIYSQFKPGIARALLCWMAVCDIHPFADGNGRIAMSWMNRELEWAGFAPCLFTREMGVTGKLGRLMQQVRKSGDISLLLPLIKQAQQTTIAICKELNKTSPNGNIIDQ